MPETLASTGQPQMDSSHAAVADQASQVVDLTQAPEVVDLTEETSAQDDAPTRGGKYDELHVDGRVVVFTDGASRGNQYRQARYAGIGAYWGNEHPFNISMPLKGEVQTNTRAELTAIIKVLQLEVRHTEIRTDSQYAFDGIRLHRQRWRRNA